MAQTSNRGTIVAVVGGLGALGVGAYLWRQRAAAAVPAATRQSLEDALRKGGAAGCQAAALAYKVPPSVSGPLCGLGSLVAVAGLKAAGKGIGKGAKAFAHSGVGRGVGKVAAAPFKALGKILHLGDIDEDLVTYAQSRPGRSRQRVKGGLQASGAPAGRRCRGACGCAPCRTGSGGSKPYIKLRSRAGGGRGKKTGGRAFYLAQLGG